MAKVAIEMRAILSGDGESWGPGSVVYVEADEAKRLIGLGAAVATAAPVAEPAPIKRERKPKGN